MGNNRTYSTPAVYSSTDKLDPYVKSGAISSADLSSSLREEIEGMDISNALPIDEINRVAGQIKVYDGRIKTLEKERPFFGSRDRVVKSDGLYLPSDTLEIHAGETDEYILIDKGYIPYDPISPGDNLFAYTLYSNSIQCEELTVNTASDQNSRYLRVTFDTHTIPLNDTTFVWNGSWYATYNEFKTHYSEGDIWQTYPDHPSGVKYDRAGELMIAPGAEGVWRLAPRAITIDTEKSYSSLDYRLVHGSNLDIKGIYVSTRGALRVPQFWQQDSIYIKNNSQTELAKIQFKSTTIAEQYNVLIPEYEDPVKYCSPDEFEENYITIL